MALRYSLNITHDLQCKVKRKIDVWGSGGKVLRILASIVDEGKFHSGRFTPREQPLVTIL
jgi:hypothetical protein